MFSSVLRSEARSLWYNWCYYGGNEDAEVSEDVISNIIEPALNADVNKSWVKKMKEKTWRLTLNRNRIRIELCSPSKHWYPSATTYFCTHFFSDSCFQSSRQWNDFWKPVPRAVRMSDREAGRGRGVPHQHQKQQQDRQGGRVGWSVYGCDVGGSEIVTSVGIEARVFGPRSDLTWTLVYPARRGLCPC